MKPVEKAKAHSSRSLFVGLGHRRLTWSSTVTWKREITPRKKVSFRTEDVSCVPVPGHMGNSAFNSLFLDRIRPFRFLFRTRCPICRTLQWKSVSSDSAVN